MHTTQTIFLDFEEPLKEVLDQIQSAKDLSENGGIDAENIIKELDEKLEAKCREIHENLTPWQKVQLSRHPERPYTLDYI
ncbi:MAG: acetyl-CoA carboxylase carboxyl transferase subunit alpha, partial [Crocinitomicaceae bacterium]|nr:acetyl-CoA carboxylase carboxyl transferase subunit alpha [Crocinitomicaceae bacterium]